jgi:hypothetical protein
MTHVAANQKDSCLSGVYMGKLAKVALIVVLLILFIAPTLWAIKYLTLTGLHSHYVEMFVGLTGLNRYLANVIVALLLIPAIYGVKLYFFSFFDKTKANIGLAMLVSVFVIYNIGLYYATKNAYFSFAEGKAAKWYAMTPEGVQFFDADGYDPKYGIKLKPVTPEMMITLEKKKLGQIPQKIKFESVDDVEFFDRLTGEVKVWYYRDQSGNFELFSGPGVHPVYGVMVQPATPQAVNEIKTSLARVATKKGEEKKEAEAQRVVTEHNAFLAKYISPGASSAPNAHGVAILALDGSGNVSPGMNQRLSVALKDKGSVTASFFTHDFVRDGLFERLYSGDAGLARRLGLKNLVGFLVLGKLNVSYKENSDMQGMTTGIVNLDIHIVASQTGAVAESFSLSETGAGFTKQDAENQAMERISGKLAAMRWNSVKTG